MKDSKLKGVFWAILSMILWASSFPVGRTLISNQMTDPVTLGMLRFGLAGFLMLVFSPFLKVRGLFRFSLRDGIILSLLGLLGISMMAIFLFTAQKTISSVNSSMIEALSPLLIFILSVFISRHFSTLQAVGLIFGFGGCLMVLKIITFTGFHLDSYQFGDFLVLCSSLCWSLYTVLGRPVIMRVGAYKFTAWTMFFGALWMLGLDLVNYDEMIWPKTGHAWLLISYFAVFPAAVAFYAWNEAQNHISLALLSLSEYFTPFCTALIALAFLGEQITLSQLTGALVICGAVLIEPEILGMMKRKKDAGQVVLER